MPAASDELVSVDGVPLPWRGPDDELVDVEALLERRSRLVALEGEVADKGEVRRALRLVEMQIGALLVKESGGRGKRCTQVGQLSAHERSEFRLLAEYRDVVEELLARGVTARREILKAVRAARAEASQVADAGDVFDGTDLAAAVRPGALCVRCGLYLRDPNRVPREHDDELCERERADVERRFDAAERAGHNADRRSIWTMGF